jgi:hypothetical protein
LYQKGVYRNQVIQQPASWNPSDGWDTQAIQDFLKEILGYPLCLWLGTIL